MGLLGMLGDDSQSLTQKAYYDETEDKLVVKTTQDVEPLLEKNKQLYQLNDGYSPDRTFRRVASIPMILVHAWLKKGIRIEDPAAWPTIAAALDSPEFAYLRTAPGRVSGKPEREYFTSSGSRKTKNMMEI